MSRSWIIILGFVVMLPRVAPAQQDLPAVTKALQEAVAEAELERADSLRDVGDALWEASTFSLEDRLRYQTARGEFFRKNAALEQALSDQLAVVEAAASLPDSNLIRAYGLFYASLTYERLTQFDSSLLYVDQAYRLFQDYLDVRDLRWSEIYNGLGACYFRANRLAEAKAFFLDAKRIAEVRLGPTSRELAKVLNNLSSISRSQENYEEAIGYSEQALEIYRALDDASGKSSAFYALGVYHFYQGDYGRTKDYMEACLTIREELYPPNHFAFIGPLEVLGIVYEQSGDYPKTLELLNESRKRIVANYGPGSIPEGYNYENTAICYQSIGQLDSALHYIELASPILTEQLPADDYSLAIHFFTRATILYELNQLEEAVAYLQRSNQVCEALGLENASEYAQNLGLQALILAEQGRWLEADDLFDRGLSIVREKGAQEGDAESFQLVPNALWMLNEYSDFLFRWYQAERQPEVLTKFEVYADSYLRLSDRFRRQFNDAYTKSVLIKDNAEVYQRMIGSYYQLYAEQGDEKYWRQAYRFSEYGRTCLLRDLQDEKVDTYAGVPDSLLVREQALRRSITTLQELFQTEPSDSLRTALFQAKEELDAFIDHLIETSPRYYQLKFDERVPEPEAIIQRLGKEQRVVEFMDDGRHYYALIFGAETPYWQRLGEKAEVDALIGAWRTQMQQQARMDEVGAALYELLWAPLAKYVPSGPLVIIPTGPLFYLNFEALPDETGSFLIERYTLSYALSLTVWASEGRSSVGGGMLAIAPGFEDDIKEAYRQGLEEWRQPDEAYLRTIRQPWAVRLAQDWDNRYQQETLIGLAAVEANVKQQLPQGNLLYFGTHAIADPADPLRSRLLLAKEPGDKEEDGYLHAYELYGIPIEADLAILNACESGIGQLQKGEGMISLAYSIHYAGCPSTVLSLWKVDEKINTQITASLLEYLDDGLPKSEALRQAKLDYLAEAEGPLTHPFYWSGMVLMGQDGKVNLQGKLPGWIWWGALGGGLLLLVGVGGWRLTGNRKQ
jgi:CHAT domain-containing protein